MSFFSKVKIISSVCFVFLASQKSVGQAGKVNVSQDPKFEQLLNEKRKINSSITINDRYKIQIFNGDTENSKKTLTEFKKDNKNMDATIVFSTPLYKVWVGNFKTRIEAEKILNDLKKKYPAAFLIKPNK
ncbi:MAG: SPOR domain-containing protein [Flavobacterium sp.]